MSANLLVPFSASEATQSKQFRLGEDEVDPVVSNIARPSSTNEYKKN